MKRPKMHLARCEYCDRKIAWSRKRRQWLALNPFTFMEGSQLRRRMVCPAAVGNYHDPRVLSPYEAAVLLLGGAR